MAIHIYKYDDPGAPNFAAEPNGQGFQALAEYVLGIHGWAKLHDSTRRATGTTTNGRVIFERPGADFVFWMDNETSNYFKVGLADAGYPDGSLTRPQSGESSNGSSGNANWFNCPNSSYWSLWYAIYDDLSDTLFFYASNSGTASYSTYSTSNECIGYLGTLDNPLSILTPALYMGDVRNNPGSTANGFGISQGTTLIDMDGSPSGEGVYLKQGSGLESTNNYSHYYLELNGGTPPFLGTWPCYGGITSDNSTGYFVDIGLIRGFKHCANGSSSYYKSTTALFFPDEYSGNRVDNPHTINGVTHYSIVGSPGLILISTDPEDWVI